MKTITAIWHTANKGKTETLRELAQLLVSTYPNHKIVSGGKTPIPLKGDFRLVLNINGKIVAIESQGDPNTGLRERLDDLTGNLHADLIFCSTRTKGDTVNAVDVVSSMHSYDLVWTSTYQTTSNYTLVNRLKAKHILELMQNLGRI